MNESSCHDIAELLVDYADGELSPSEAARVEAHLRACHECRAELGRLRRSLEVAKGIWSEAASGVSAPELHPVLPQRRRMVPVVAVAACVALLAVVGVWLLVQFHRGQDRPGHTGPEQIAETPQPNGGREESNGASAPESGGGESEVPDLREIETRIARAGRSARLAVSAELLSTRPELQPYRKQADRYLAAVYADTAAGDAAARRIDLYPKKEPKS